jgi:hypothetical protein
MKEKIFEKRVRVPECTKITLECECGVKHKFENMPDGVFVIVRMKRVDK